MDEEVFPMFPGSSSDSPSGPANLLARSASAYLRSAAQQPVGWHAWSEEAFARAQAENKPILLDIGAVWCHWCHVMDHESYEDEEIAALINEHYVAVKVDRDERPEVDARYQMAVSALSGQGGWPLTVFLTPDGRPFYGGTYFPREDGYQRPGFGRVLAAMAAVWRERRDEVLVAAAETMAVLEGGASFSGQGGAASPAQLERIIGSILAQFDPRNGGFGTAPKFPHPAALDLLLAAAVNRGNEQAGAAFCTTLERMARGGVYDQLAGGFHRYSVDEGWRVPHFEKMLYDNTELLRNFLHGYQTYGRADFRRTAEEIVAWLDGTLSDRRQGGFYASQDADISRSDDGDYFTWTLDEARMALEAAGFSREAMEPVLRYWKISERGEMRHAPERNVLRAERSVEEMAAGMGQSAEPLRARIDDARRALLAARARRPSPFVDRTLYTGWNAMAVSAYLEAARILGLEAARDFALLTLGRLLCEAWDGERSLGHVIAYDSATEEKMPPRERAPGTLDDYALTVHAALDAWLSSGEMRFYRAAAQLADAMVNRFFDPVAGAFDDIARPAENDAPQLGALSVRRKPIQDAPTPAGNPAAAGALLRLESLSGERRHRETARRTLEAFVGIAEHFGLYAGSYGLALERLLREPVQVVVVGRGAEAERMTAVGMGRFAVHRTVVRIDAERLLPEGVPPALAEILPGGLRSSGAAPWAVVCRGHTCLLPVSDAEALAKALQEPA
ncbi:MAG: thioredoxin domain-containing protein [Terracidiphilus sp.]